ncbi:MAG TPA: uracil-DNA glycosylase [Gemmata sp.]|jgi:uracil-DNA glycosylase|nr:uracil-DNA glycosylase [Gemmata sp.]
MGKNKPTARTPSLFDNEDAFAEAGNESKIESPPDYPLPDDLDSSWLKALTPETRQPYWNELQRFVATEREQHTVYPPAKDVFNAFRNTPLDKVKVFLLGQDPYPGAGQAHGLCFSVQPGIPLPGSLRNIYQELNDDLGIKPVKHGYLVSWARQGVLMLNACLTVRANATNSHAGKGWEKFTDAALREVNAQKRKIVFLLWGAYAQKKIPLIDQKRHLVIKSAHPSPLSAHNGFFGSKPFSKINEALKAAGEIPIDWKLPERVSEEQ